MRGLEVLVGGVLVAGHLHRGHVPLLGRRRWVEREACRSAGAASLSVASRGPSATHHDNAGDDDDEDRDAADGDAERHGAERLDRATWLLHVRLTSRITMQSFRCCPLVAQFEFTFFSRRLLIVNMCEHDVIRNYIPFIARIAYIPLIGRLYSSTPSESGRIGAIWRIRLNDPCAAIYGLMRRYSDYLLFWLVFLFLLVFFVFATILALEPRLLRDAADTESHRMLNEAGDDYNNF